jgi:cathepsin D
VSSILGMGYPAISNLGKPPFVNTAFEQGSIPSNEFAFYLAKIGSELFLGGTDASKYIGAIEYHGISSQSGFWQIGDASTHVNSNVVNTGFQTIIDSGTTIMYGPPNDVEAFYSHVHGSRLYDANNGFYSFPCLSPPAVSFSWGGKIWSISEAK